MKRIILLLLTIQLTGCGSPTVKITASDKPIEINLNIKIDHNINIKIDKEAEELVSKNEDGIF